MIMIVNGLIHGKIGTFLKSNVSKTGVCYPEVTKLLEKMGDDDHGSDS